MAQLRRSPVSSNSKKSVNPIAKAMGRARHSSFYHDLSLRGENPLRLLGTPADIWPGSVTAGTQIVSGKMVGGGHVLENPSDDQNIWTGEQLWRAEDLSKPWLEHLHSFNWLKDLNQAVDQGAATKRAEDLVESWIDHHTGWGEISWRVDIVGERLTNWLTYIPLIMDTDDVIYRGRVLDLMARSARHIMKMTSDLPDGPDGLKALIGLLLSGLYIPNGDDWIKEGTSQLKFALSREVLIDGGLRSRNPQELLRIFKALVLLRDAFSDMSRQCPPEIEPALERMAGFLKQMVHGDGKLATFNGSLIQNHEDIYATLKKAGVKENKDAKLDPSGFIRLEKGRSVLILDGGPPAELELSRQGHSGTHSFEFSRGKDRLIVNCGDASFVRDADGHDLRAMSRGSSAHSTLVVGGKNSSQVRDDGLIGTGVTVMKSQVLEEKGHSLLETEHDGYARFGYLHKRLIYLNDKGEDIRGEDILEALSTDTKENPNHFEIRFHLHPNVSVTLSNDGNMAYLGLSNGETWQFRHRGADMHLEDSIYFAQAGKISTTKQLVLSGKTDGSTTSVLWSLKLE